MIQEITSLVDQYRAWLKDKTALRQVDDAVEITTPFIDRHNDYIQIYARRENGGYLLTDDGYTINDLATSGCSLTSPKRQELLRISLAGFGVRTDAGALVVHATAENFALRKHNLIQSILAVNDLFFLAKPYVKTVFLEDVTAWLDEIDVRYTPKIKFSGQSGYDHVFDFAIPKSKVAPERLLRAINHPTKNAFEAFAFAWVDTRDTRPPESRSYAILNDQEETVPPAVDVALGSYNVVAVHWNEREKIREELAA